MGGMTPKLKKPEEGKAMKKVMTEFKKDPVAFRKKRRSSYESKGYSVLTGKKMQPNEKKTLLG